MSDLSALSVQNAARHDGSEDEGSRVEAMKRQRPTAESLALIEQVALERLRQPKILTDAELMAQTGLSKACIHRYMARVKLSVKVETRDTQSLQPASDGQTASESAMPYASQERWNQNPAD